MKIYVAGPLNDNAVGYLKNVSRMCKVAVELRKKGHAVFVPCLDLLLGIVAGDWEYEDYFENNQAFLEDCDALYLIGHSPGADKELKAAEYYGLQIFYRLPEVPFA